MKLLHYTNGTKPGEDYVVLEYGKGPWPVIEAGFVLHCVATITETTFADLDHLPTGRALR